MVGFKPNYSLVGCGRGRESLSCHEDECYSSYLDEERLCTSTCISKIFNMVSLDMSIELIVCAMDRNRIVSSERYRMDLKP